MNEAYSEFNKLSLQSSCVIMNVYERMRLIDVLATFFKN